PVGVGGADGPTLGIVLVARDQVQPRGIVVVVVDAGWVDDARDKPPCRVVVVIGRDAIGISGADLEVGTVIVGRRGDLRSPRRLLDRDHVAVLVVIVIGDIAGTVGHRHGLAMAVRDRGRRDPFRRR